MPHLPFISIFFSTLISLCFVSQQAHCRNVEKRSTDSNTFTFPEVKRIPKVWSFPSTNGNVTYTDSYYWMETANETDTDLEKFFSDQDMLTKSYMSQCKDRDLIQQALLEATEFDYIDIISQWGDPKGNQIYIYSLQRYGEQRPTWYIASPAEFEAGKKNIANVPVGRAFLNESLLSSDQTVTVLSTTVSPDALTFGYLVSDVNSDLATWYFRSIDSPLLIATTTPRGGEGRLALTIPFTTTYADLIWFSDGSGFFYHQGADPNGGRNLDAAFKIRYHNWSDVDDSKDITLIHADDFGVDSTISNSLFMFFVLSDDDRWLIVSGYYNTDGKVRTYATLLNNRTVSENMEWISLAPDFDFQMIPMTFIDDWYYFRTNYQAKNSKVVKVKLDFSKAKNVKTLNELQDRPPFIDVIKERKDAFILLGQISTAVLAHDKAIVIYLENGKNVAYLYDLLTGKELQHILPDEIISYPIISSSAQSNQTFFLFTSFDTPAKLYELDYDNDQVNVTLLKDEFIAGTKADDFEVEQLYATSKDGTKVPYFVTSKKDLSNTGFVWMHVYAAYGDIDNLFFEPNYFTFMNKYGPTVWCGARGGGEEGDTWHDKGKGVHKQNTFDDIIACCEDVVKRGIASEGNIILEGGSAGGLAAAAVINQAREGLIGAALLEHGMYDLFQFELRASLGANNVQEFGDVNKPDEVETVMKWSPFQNIDPKRNYPATLVQVGAQDDIVPPNQAYRYLAQLQFTHPNSSTPLIMYLNTGQGHLANTAVDPMIFEALHQFCMIELALGAKMN